MNRSKLLITFGSVITIFASFFLGGQELVKNQINPKPITYETKEIIPAIVNYSFSNIGYDDAIINYEVLDPENRVEYILFRTNPDEGAFMLYAGENINAGISDNKSDSLDLKQIGVNLVENHTYETTFCLVYTTDAGGTMYVSENKSLITTKFPAPKIQSILIDNITTNSFDFYWEVIDDQKTITSIVLKDGDKVLSKLNDLKGVVQITNLKANTVFNNLNLEIGYLNSLNETKTITKAIDSVTTLPKETNNLMLIIGIALISLITLLLFFLLLLTIWKKREKRLMKKILDYENDTRIGM